MDFRVEFSETAIRELEETVEYIADVLDNPQSAERFYNKIQEKALALGYNPFIFPQCLDERLFEKGYRYVIVGNYMIIYSVDEEKSLVYIRNVIYGRRDIGSIIK